MNVREEYIEEEEEEDVEIGANGGYRDTMDAKAKAKDKGIVEREVKEGGDDSGVGEGQRDGLRTKEDANGVEEGLKYEIRE